MCVNLTKLNEAILRERHDLPTVDHVLGLLGDATTFENAQQFEQVFHQGCSLRRMQGNNSVLLNNNKAAIINNILSCEGAIHVVGRSFGTMTDLYTGPCKLSLLDVNMVSGLSSRFMVRKLKEIRAKCFLYPRGAGYACFLIQHSTSP